MLPNHSYLIVKFLTIYIILQFIAINFYIPYYPYLAPNFYLLSHWMDWLWFNLRYHRLIWFIILLTILEFSISF